MKKQENKIIKNLTIFGGATLLTGTLAIAGVKLYDYNIDHTNEVCLITKLFGVEHQIEQIEEETLKYLPLHNEEQTFHKTYSFEKEIRKEIPGVYGFQTSSEDGELKYEIIEATFSQRDVVTETFERDIVVSAGDDEIVLVDKNNYSTKTLKLR